MRSVMSQHCVGHRAPRARILAMLSPLLLVPALILASAVIAQPQAPAVSEQSVKAAFLYKFAEYVDWPESPSADAAADAESPFTIAVLGSGTLAEDLARVTVNRTVNKRPIRVRQLMVGDAVDDAQMLFITDDHRDGLGALLSPLRDRPILTVTESKGALADGSVINFTVNDDRVRFEISMDAAESHRLRLSSRLLAVAERVYQTRQVVP